MSAEILIVGAGPTGLTLGLMLERGGVDFRIIDAEAGPAKESRALAIYPRTLELLSRLDVLPPLLEEGLFLSTFNMHFGHDVLTRFTFDAGESRFDYPLVLAQNKTEALLEEALRRRGHVVERNTKFICLETSIRDGEPMLARIASAESGEEVQLYNYVVGCDGPRSRVRHEMNIIYRGRTYEGDFRHLDAPLHWSYPDDEAHIFQAPNMGVGVFPQGQGIFRVVVLRDEVPDEGPSSPTREEIEEILQELCPVPVSIGEPSWIAQFQPALHLARDLRRGPVFLAGDAARQVPPTGGQGMNAGMQDAENLGWKLAMVVQGGADESLLDSYDPERRVISKKIMSLADLFLRTAVRTGKMGHRFTRLVLPRLFARDAFRRRLSRRLFQIDLNVRGSSIVDDDRPPGLRTLRAGDPLPPIFFVTDGRRREFNEEIRGDSFVVLLYLDEGTDELHRRAQQLSSCFGSTVRVLTVTASDGEGAGDYIDDEKRLARCLQFGRHGCVVLRPDLQIAYVVRSLDLSGPVEFLRKIGIVETRRAIGSEERGGALAGREFSG